MFRVNKDGVLEEVYAIEDLCDHCKSDDKECFPWDRIGDIRITSPGLVGIKDKYTFEVQDKYTVECNRFESRDGIYRVKVEVKETGVILE